MNALHPRAAAAAVSAASPRHAAPRRAASSPRPTEAASTPGRGATASQRMDQGRAAVQARRPGGLGGLGGGERGRRPTPPRSLLAAAAARRGPSPRRRRARLVDRALPSSAGATRRGPSRHDGAGEASRRSIALSSSRHPGSAPRSASGRRSTSTPRSRRPRGRALGRARAHRALEEASTSRAASRAAAIRASLGVPTSADSASARGAATREAGPDPGRMARPPGRPGARRSRTSAGRAPRRGRGDGPRRVRPRAREPRGSPRRRLVLAGVRRDVEARAPGDARSLAVARPGRVRGGRPKGGARRREPSATGRRETREGGARDVHHRRAKILRGGEKARRKPGRRRKPSRARPGGPARVVASEGSEDENERSGGGGETNTRAVRYVRRAVRGVRRSARVGVGEGYPARERVESSEGEGKRKRPAAVRRRRVRARTHPGRRSGSGSGSGSLPPRSDRLVGGDDARLSRAGRDAGARGVRRAGPVAAAAAGGGTRRRSATSRAAFSFQARSTLERPLLRGSNPEGASSRPATPLASRRIATPPRPGPGSYEVAARTREAIPKGRASFRSRSARFKAPEPTPGPGEYAAANPHHGMLKRSFNVTVDA